jgi:hypothetical protein
MFYSTQLLSRKSPLGICWLASHLEGKKLKRTQVGSALVTFIFRRLAEKNITAFFKTRGATALPRLIAAAPRLTTPSPAGV